jgi:hypothetical protein
MSRVRLTPADEQFLHQIPYTLDTVCTADPDYRERIWLSISDATNRDLMIGCGIGHYPNRNIQEGWAGITVGDRQHNVRMSRHLRPQQQTMAVTPLRVEPIEPLRRVRYVLEENASGIAFDFEFESTFEPHIEDHHLEIRNGRIVHDLTRYNIVGRAYGVASYPGGELKLDGASWKGGRDHSWGVQPDQQNVSTPTQLVNPRGSLYTLCYAQFEDWGAFFYLMERAPGIWDYLSGSFMRRGETARLRITAVEHNYRWAKNQPVQVAEAADFVLMTDDGARHAFSCTFYRPRYFLRSALYLGWRGWWQGADKGDYHFDHDVWNLADRAALPEYSVAGGGFDHHAICRAADGGDGHAAFEYFVTPGYPRYQEIQARPSAQP